MKERGVYLGPRLRRLRRDLGLTQAEMANDLDISASYVALMERNQRAITADMLLRLAQTYRIDLTEFAASNLDDDAARLERIFEDPLFSEIKLSSLEANEVARAYPAVSSALTRLYGAYKEGQLALADNQEGAGGDNPVAEARNFLSKRRNSFPTIDDHAERLGQGLVNLQSFIARIEERHGLKVRRLPPAVMTDSIRRLDRHRSELVLDASLDVASQKFQLALQIAYLEMGASIDETEKSASDLTENGRRLVRRSLANYAAAALIFPYATFRQTAEDMHYDVEGLARTFGASFEQTAHRLTTLQKPGEEGIPFFFIRIDAAGNVSKRLDGAGFPFASHGGSCPLWSLHSVFKRPREIVTQWVELPGGEKFFSIARTVNAGGGFFGAPRAERAIALGCAAEHAHRLVYASGRTLEAERPDPIGVTCRLCHRPKCIARSEPPLGRQVLPEDYRRADYPFGFVDE